MICSSAVSPALMTALCPGLLVGGSSSTGALTSGNVIVSTNEVLHEYTTDGVLVQSIEIPYPGPGSATESARDVAVDPRGRAYVYNGTFDPYLSVLLRGGESWWHGSLPGWNTINNGTYGGIAVTRRHVFLTDMRLSGEDATLQGMVRVDIQNGTWERFAQDIEPIDLNLGLDDKLYALYPGGSPGGRMIDVYHPATLAYERTIDLTATLGFTAHRSIAVNAEGEIFLADWDSELQRLDENGNLLDVINLNSAVGSFNLYDVDVSAEGVVVVGDRFGSVVVTDESFSAPTAFDVGGGGVFVDIVP